MNEELQFCDSISSRAFLFPLPKKHTWYTRFLLPRNADVAPYMWASVALLGLWDNVHSPLAARPRVLCPSALLPCCLKAREQLESILLFRVSWPPPPLSSPWTRWAPTHLSGLSSDVTTGKDLSQLLFPVFVHTWPSTCGASWDFAGGGGGLL